MGFMIGSVVHTTHANRQPLVLAVESDDVVMFEAPLRQIVAE